MTTMITMLAPDGSSGDIPMDKVEAAKQAGFKVAVTMKAPNGKTGYVPAESVHDAASAGFRMIPLDVPEAAKASYWDALTNPVGSGGREQGILGGALQIGGQAIKAAVQPFAHPIDTLVGAYNMVRHPLDTAGQIANQVKADYQQGGVPLAAENVAGQILGGVEGGRVLGGVSSAAVKATAPVVSKIADKSAVGLYRNALKPPPGSMTAAQSTAKVRTGLDYGLPVSASGVEKLGDLIDEYNNKIKDQIAQDPNRPINPNSVASRADIAKQKFANQVNAQPDLNAIEASRQQFLKEQGAPTDAQGNITGPAPDMGAAKAQAMKQGTYRVLSGKYGEQGSATVEAQKALARGLKEEIANQFPEINDLNATESKLLNLQPTLERAVNRISNNHTIGIGGPIVAGGLKAATGSTGVAAAIGAMKSVFDIPAIKSQVAIALSKGAKIPYAAALARVSAYQASLGSAAGAIQGYSSSGNSNPQATSTP